MKSGRLKHRVHKVPWAGVAALTLLLAVRMAGASAIGQATCEQTGNGTYLISFEGWSAKSNIAIYASSHPDRIDTRTPLLKTRSSPVEVAVPGIGRIYFHLKPPSGPTRVVSVRRLPLEGAANFRDLGGYRTSDGHYVKWGLVYRTGNFNKLTEKDYEYLAGLGINLVCDFRLDWERKQSPTKWIGEPGPKILINPIDSYSVYGISANGAGQGQAPPAGPPQAPAAGPPPVPAAAPGSGGAAPSGMPTDYAWLDSAKDQLALTFRHIINGSLPLVFHCSSGKDRTGVMATLLLGALGVPQETIMSDFLLSNTYLVPDSKIPQLAADIQKRQGLAGPPDDDTVRIMSGGVHPQLMKSFFQMLDKKQMSFEAYLLDELQLTPKELAAVRKRLLEP